jgi:hypothetical protein
MKTKLSFRIWDKKEKRYLEGWQEVQQYGMGIMNDNKDKTKISICFFKVPDDYLEIHKIEGE